MSNFKIWWLIPGQLGGMPIPLEESDFTKINNNGVKAVVNLLEKPINKDKCKQAELETLWLPIQDMNVPTLEQVQQFKQFIETKKEEQKPVAIHCFAGQGRTGTMLATWLILSGTSPDEAIEQVRNVNPQAIESSIQEAFLNRLPSLL